MQKDQILKVGEDDEFRFKSLFIFTRIKKKNQIRTSCGEKECGNIWTMLQVGILKGTTNLRNKAKALASGFVIKGYHRPVRTFNSCLHCENRLGLSGDFRTEEMMTLARFCLPCELWLSKMRLISVYSVCFIFQTNFNSNLLALWKNVPEQLKKSWYK